MKRIDIQATPVRVGSGYPPPHAAPCAARIRRRLGDAGGLTAFGVNQLTLPPGAWSSQRHWHSTEDEFVMVLSGEVVLITDAGEETLRAGDCAAFPAGEPDGHHLINRGPANAVVLEVGTRRPDDRTVYSDIDMIAEPGEDGFRHRDGAPYLPA
ncbi:MAG TPA: cupin domain-containing protein [Caulobacteraceae bacterium]|jgi:uncharacterized cupin superfamily protein|nr:cupin domain-containing protein [Caulobacteraceae bacterium]